MPVTKTARRALRSSIRKQKVNEVLTSKLEIALRIAKKSKKEKDVKIASSLADRASKKKFIHANKAARIKSSLSKLLPTKNKKTLKPTKVQSSPERKK